MVSVDMVSILGSGAVPDVLYERARRVATLTLNRPDRLNAITRELVGELRTALQRAWDDDAIRAIRLRGAGRAFCAGLRHRLGRGGDARGRGRPPVGPDRRLPDDVRLRRRLHAAVALAQAGDRPGPRLLRRRRHRLRAVLRPHRLRRGLPHRLPAGAGVGLADDGDVDLPPRARALQAPAAHRRRARRPPRGRVGPGERGVARGRARRRRAGARRARRAAARRTSCT